MSQFYLRFRKESTAATADIIRTLRLRTLEKQQHLSNRKRSPHRASTEQPKAAEGSTGDVVLPPQLSARKYERSPQARRRSV